MSWQQPPITEVITRLRILLVTRCSLDELCELCQDLGIDYEDWYTSGKRKMARELLEECRRRNQLLDLVTLCHSRRKDVEWPSVAEVAATPPPEQGAPGPSEGAAHQHVRLKGVERPPAEVAATPPPEQGAPDPSEGAAHQHATPKGVERPPAAVAATLPPEQGAPNPSEGAEHQNLLLAGGLIVVLAISFIVFTRVASGDFTPPTPQPPAPTTPTPRPPISRQDLSQTAPYTDADALFYLNIPSTWRLDQIEKPADGSTIVYATFAPQAHNDLLWRIFVELIDNNKTAEISTLKLGPYVKSYVRNTYGAFPNFVVNEPVYTANQQAGDLRSVRVQWSFTIEGPGGTNIPMRAITEARLQGEFISVFTLYMPRDQFDTQEDMIGNLSASLTLGPALREANVTLSP